MQISNLIGELAEVHGYMSQIADGISTKELRDILKTLKEFDTVSEEHVSNFLRGVIFVRPELVKAGMTLALAQEIANRMMREGELTEDI